MIIIELLCTQQKRYNKSISHPQKEFTHTLGEFYYKKIGYINLEITKPLEEIANINLEITKPLGEIQKEKNIINYKVMTKE